MDSLAIAQALEKTHPSPSLHLDHPSLAEVSALVDKGRMAMGAIALPQVVRALNPVSAEYKEKWLTSTFNMDVDQFEKEKGGEPAWDRLWGPLGELAAVLKREEGPFVMGNTVSYADFIIAAILQTGKRIGNGAMFDRMVAFDAAFARLFAATEKWAVPDRGLP